MSATDELIAAGAPFVLRGGSQVRESSVRQLTDIDHHDREAVIALEAHGTEALGVARYVRRAARPDAAEVAIPAGGVAPELTELLRLVAEHDVAVPVTRRDGHQTTL